MIHAIEELRQIDIDDPAIAFVYMCLHGEDRLMGTAARSEAVARIRECRLEHWTQDLMQRLLNQAILYSRGTEQAFPALRFGNADPANCLWLVASGQ